MAPPGSLARIESLVLLMILFMMYLDWMSGVLEFLTHSPAETLLPFLCVGGLGPKGGSEFEATPEIGQSDAQLKTDLEGYQGLLDGFGDGWCLIDSKGFILACSSKIQRGKLEGPVALPLKGAGGNYLEILASISEARCAGVSDFMLRLQELLSLRVEAQLCIELAWSKDQWPRWMEVRARNIEIKKARCCLLTHQDVTANVMVKRGSESKRKILENYHEEQEELQLILDSVHSQIWQLDLMGDVLRLNTSAQHAAHGHLGTLRLGYQPRIEDVWENPVLQNRRSLEVLTTGKPILGAVEKCRHNGTIGWSSVDRIPMRRADGAILGLLVVIDDISELKTKEAALRTEESFLREMGHVARVGGWEFDVRTSKLRWTKQVYEIHELDPSMAPDVPNAINFYRADERHRIQRAVELALSEGKEYELELPMVTAKGREIWVHTIGRAEFESGKVVRIFGAIQDVTERRRVWDRLRESEERFQLASSATSDGLWDWNLASSDMWWSSGYFKILGLAPEQITPSYEYWVNHLTPMIVSECCPILRTD